MKAAITVWGDRLSPLCDSARNVLIVDIDNGKIVRRRSEPFQADTPFQQAVRLSDLEVEVLICGAISEPLANIIEAHGIRIVPFIAGNTNRVLEAHLVGELDSIEFQMPGCGGGHNRRFKTRFRGGR
ncbi:MAG: dinitrogenase iron-molybdenum cofactor biosynthesis domain-containing protein [Proteobacteria bacterium]|nr:dinitrogenase iron-molybdenum cofactor biosynthesis domain-containing protein [Pseudomonadota bacterium]